MTEIYLTDDQYGRLPYRTTTISRAKTYGDIIGLLESHGIKDYQWTRYQGLDQLAFPLTIKRQDLDQQFMIKMVVPKLMYSIRLGRGRNSPKKMTYLENVSWRIFWWYLKSKLEAIEYGISDEAREFLYNIHYALPNGREIGIGDMIMENVKQLDKLALKDRRIIDADVEGS